MMVGGRTSGEGLPIGVQIRSRPRPECDAWAAATYLGLALGEGQPPKLLGPQTPGLRLVLDRQLSPRSGSIVRWIEVKP